MAGISEEGKIARTRGMVHLRLLLLSGSLRRKCGTWANGSTS